MLNLEVCQSGAESLCSLAEEAPENAPVRPREVSFRCEARKGIANHAIDQNAPGSQSYS